MPTVAQIAAALESLAPLSLATDWDNPGLQVGNATALVTRVMVAVDASDAVVAQAVARSIELIVAHHPLIFHPLRAVVQSDAIGGRVADLVRHNIALYAAHTNLDAAPRYGTAQALAEALRLIRVEPLVVGGEGTMPPVPHEPVPNARERHRLDAGTQPEAEATPALGRLGRLVQAMSATELAQHVADTLGTRNVRLYGDASQSIGAVAVVPGAGGDGIVAAANAGVGAFITGELTHHQVLELLDQGLIGLSVGHLASERPVREVVGRLLQSRWPDLAVVVADEPPLETLLNLGSVDGRMP